MSHRDEDGAAGQDRIPRTSAARGTRERRAAILALGDSYTVGEGVTREASWPAVLARRLRAEGVSVAEPRVIARTGWSCDELLDAVHAARDTLSAAAPFTLVTLLAGVNDHYRGRPVAAWRPAFESLFEEATQLAGGRPSRVLVVSVPDWGRTSFARDRDEQAISRGIDEVNLVQRSLAAARGAAWIDVTELGRRLAGRSEVEAADGLHPSAMQYETWVERILPIARQILRSA